VGDNRRLVRAGVSDSLVEPDVGVASLNALYLKVNTGESVTYNVRAVNAAFELYASTSLVAIAAQKFCKFEFTVFSFRARVHPRYLAIEAAAKHRQPSSSRTR
jgi:hypothetical protein